MSSATRLFVGNLPDEINEDALHKAFSVYGEITKIDIKIKPGTESEKKVFAFVSLSASNYNVESCIKHFNNEDFNGQRLYVTKARESFLERLQREREQSQKGIEYKEQNASIPKLVVEKINTNKRNFDNDKNTFENPKKKIKSTKQNDSVNTVQSFNSFNKLSDDKKLDSDKKRLESIKRKRQEFNEKKHIIKTGLTSIDKQTNKKVIFSDVEEENDDQCIIKRYSDYNQQDHINNQKLSLFEDGISDDETNFDLKKQFEGKKGHKVLELQSKYKSDKRFTLDERFVEEDESENEAEENCKEGVDVGQENEKSKQLDILQNVLGVPIKITNSDGKNKMSKQAMFRFDPSHPDHAKFLAPVEAKPDVTKKVKKAKNKEIQENIAVIEKVEVSKEQFYEISNELKETITQPKEFSLRSLFDNVNSYDKEPMEQKEHYVLLENKKEKKVRNALDPSERNPFVYDSSESDNEDDVKNITNHTPNNMAPKVVWREKLFFGPQDNRLEDGLIFFTQNGNTEIHKDRRELKSLMKKRIYNKERKNHMFKKKIGGRKKTMKKSFKKRS